MILNQDFKEFIESLNENDVQHLVIGGYAVAFHGHPRYTKDLDIWVGLNKSNAEKMIKALDQFGFASLGLDVDDFLESGIIIQLGYPPNRIDLMIGLEGMDFEECYASKEVVVIEGVSVNFIDLQNLVKSKRLSGRHQDLADIENLQ